MTTQGTMTRPKARQAMTLSEAAAARVKQIMAGRSDPAIGVRIGVRNGGCSGMAYTMEFATDKNAFDELVEDKGVTILIDPKAIMFLVGTEMDYVEQTTHAGFVFNNPNETGRCGCGESFTVG